MARSRLTLGMGGIIEPSRSGDRATRIPVVGVMGSGTEPHEDRARPIGEWLARAGVHLLTGGGGGVMASVSRAFHAVPDRAGSVIGILPGLPGPHGPLPPAGYPNPWVEIAICTHLPLSGDRGTEERSRNPINVLSSDVIVALPGSWGTASEAELALRFGRPIVAFVDGRHQIDGLPEAVRIEPDIARVRRFVLEHLG